MMKVIKKMVNYALPLGIVLALLLISVNGHAYAATAPVTINTVDYTNENIIVNNNGNSRIDFATENDAAKNSWEVLNSDTGNTTAIDFSWVSPTTEQVIVIKGEDGTQRRVTLRERTKKLEVSISYDRMAGIAKTDTIAKLLNVMSSAGTGESPITFYDLEWRKGENGSWQGTSSLTVAQLEKLQIKGADLYFRIKAVNDTAFNADGTNGRRVSKEVRLKISKKASPIVIGIDGEDFTADIRYGKEYRVTHGSVKGNWIKVTDKSIREVSLALILSNGSDGFAPSTRFPAMMIEIRDYATARAAASKITEIILNEQRTLDDKGTPNVSLIIGNAPDNADSSDTNIYISYNGSANISITIPSASTDNPYQYAIVKPGDVFDNERVSWSSITRSSAVKVLSSKAVEDSEIFIRKKEIKSKLKTRTLPAVNYELASTYLKHNIEYPSVPVIEPENFTFVKGISDSLTFSIKLNNKGKLPFETEIRSIKIGTREINFSTTSNITDPLSKTVEYTINVTLNKNYLNDMPNSYSRALYITFENGTVNKTAVKLAIQSPTPATTITATASKGKTTGTTSIRVITTVRSGNELVYTRTGTKVEGLNTENVISGTTFVQEADIAVTTGEYVTVYEIETATKKVVRYKCIEITSLYINP